MLGIRQKIISILLVLSLICGNEMVVLAETSNTTSNIIKPIGDATIIASGECGESATWSLDKGGTLTISGTGEIDYSIGYKQQGTKIKKLVIEEGITHIGEDAFRGLSSIKGDLMIPDSVTIINHRAFKDCNCSSGKFENCKYNDIKTVECAYSNKIIFEGKSKLE